MAKKPFRRIVVKIGTSSLMKDNSVNRQAMTSLARELSELRSEGREIILVTSGAIGFGMEKMGRGFPEDPVMRQAMAAIGQSRLMHEYENAFRKHGQVIAQVLPIHQNFLDRKLFMPLKETVEKLIQLGAIPIINENDAVSVEEITGKAFSDNDALAALVATGFSADLLVMLTDVDGIYTDNPKTCGNTKKIDGIGQLLSEPINIGKKSEHGRGGMASKISAVKKAVAAGCSTAVCVTREGAVLDAAKGKCTGSFFGVEN
ncbi:MAG: glutamate 5-kinase [Candidatus Diapherotrites archaeon]|uniref:Glutamate 5-kinase n=1 Tax=Candidatus Iainarchaeum sp. TaxID=3101447 RepID=A0A8T3YJD2_9ARCH|nr:glutamate 5-kinase [Candidatus Diapherotrites archaeon]